MDKISIDNIEMGNLLFGHSRGNYLIPREEWQELFVSFLDACGFDGYGHPNKDELDSNVVCKFSESTPPDENGYQCHIHYFENDVFIINPYYWGDAEDLIHFPNFIYKPTNFTISWYKYPLRNAYASHDITVEEFADVLNKCFESMGGNS